MTPQEIFDTAYTRLVNQGAPAQTPSGRCMYLDPDTGRRCAVGLLMNDDEVAYYGPREGTATTIVQLDRELPDRVLRDFFHDHQYLLNAIQNVHDNAPHHSGFRDYVRKGMAEVALKNNLSPAILNVEAV